MSTAAGADVVGRSLRMLRPPPAQTVSEWADAERRLSPESSAEPGRWRTSRTPYLREVMDSINDPDIHTVVFMKSAQVGATEALNNVLGYLIHRSPCPILVMQPTELMGKAWSKDRLDPMIRDTPALAPRVHGRRSAEGGSNILHKSFPGGHVTITGANSAAGLASRPIRIVLGDEVDRYPVSAGEEGDPLELARKRTTTFHNRKIFIPSTPTIAGRSRIEREFLASDQRYFLVPCPECGEFQRLKWSQIQWRTDAEGKPSEVRYVCEHCGCTIENRQKRKMLAEGRWEATQHAPGVAGFHISELYSPWSTWESMVVAFLKAKKGGKETLKTWINTSLGEVWVEHEARLEPHQIEERAERYETGTPPKSCLVLTAGVDVQADRLEVLIKGWSHDGEGWAVDWRFLPGDPSRPEIWRRLDEEILAPLTREDGLQLRVAATCVDSGYLADEVYRFTQPRFARRVYATKGFAGEGRPIAGRPSKVGKRSSILFPVGVDTAKDLFFARLSVRTHGPGFQHYPQGFDREFFEQITSETKERSLSRGQDVSRWVKLRPRNEALDLEVLNLVAFSLLNPNLRKIERNQSAGVEDVHEPAELPPEVDVTQEMAKQRKTRRKRRRFSVR